MSEIPPPPAVPPSTPPPPGGGSYTPPPPPPPPLGGGPVGGGPSSGAGGDRTIMLVLSYLGIFALIPLLTKKDDSEVQWHAKNGLAIFFAEILIWIVLIVLGRIPFLGCLAVAVSCVLPIAFLALFVFCVIQALNGKRPRIPVISDFAEKINL